METPDISVLTSYVEINSIEKRNSSSIVKRNPFSIRVSSMQCMCKEYVGNKIGELEGHENVFRSIVRQKADVDKLFFRKGFIR